MRFPNWKAYYENMKYICIFGDSTAWGAYDMEKGGWANRLWLHFIGQKDEKFHGVYNLSIDGGTTETILARFESEAKIRDAEVLIFQSGGNDAARKGKDGDCLVPLEKYRENIREIVRKARQITPEIVFMGFEHADEAKTTPVYWDDIYYWNKDIDEYNAALREICNEENVLYIPLADLQKNGLSEDGLHLTESGHQKIFETVRDFLVENHFV